MGFGEVWVWVSQHAASAPDAASSNAGGSAAGPTREQAFCAALSSMLPVVVEGRNCRRPDPRAGQFRSCQLCERKIHDVASKKIVPFVQKQRLSQCLRCCQCESRGPEEAFLPRAKSRIDLLVPAQLPESPVLANAGIITFCPHSLQLPILKGKVGCVVGCSESVVVTRMGANMSSSLKPIKLIVSSGQSGHAAGLGKLCCQLAVLRLEWPHHRRLRVEA